MSTPTHATRLSVDYFDGHSARAHRVSMWIEGGMLQLSGRELIRQVPLSKVQWPERTRHGIRLAHFTDGGSVQGLDSTDWDAWVRQHQLGEPLVVRAQQSWRWTALATVLLLLVTVMGYWWGLPLAARAITPLIPAAVDKQVGDAALQAMDQDWLQPSKLPPHEQARWRARFDQALQRQAQSWPSGHAVHPFALHFRRSSMGPNAFALPGGSIVVTDEMVHMLKDREDVLLGVLGHEAGHVRLRHGMRTLIQTSLLGAATSVALGDFSSLLAGAPALLGHLAYSRDLEREADDAAIHLLRANGIRPSVMVLLFERLALHQQRGAPPPAENTASQPRARRMDTLGIALSSHPADDERIARFKAADLGLATRTVPD